MMNNRGVDGTMARSCYSHLRPTDTVSPLPVRRAACVIGVGFGYPHLG